MIPVQWIVEFAVNFSEMENAGFGRWMIALDMTEHDETLVKWTRYLADILKPEMIYFIHVEKDFDIPDYLPEELKEPFLKDEGQRNAMERMVGEHFGDSGFKVGVEVIEGNPFDTLLHWADVKRIDLFVAGRKDTRNGSGVLPHKLSRRLPCMILFIPELEEPVLSRTIVPIDFSEHSKLALQTAAAISEAGRLSLVCSHVYHVPIGYYKTGKSFEEFSEIMKRNAEEEFHRFSGGTGIPVEFVSDLHKDSSIEDLLLRQIEETNADLLVMGSKGQSAGSLILLGSTTEKIIRKNDKCLTLVVKKKDEHLSLFEALKKL